MKHALAGFCKIGYALLLSGVFMAGIAHATPMQQAKLQWLDKVTARISNFTLNLNEQKQIGPLNVTLRHCDRTPPQETPESTAFIEITEQQQGKELDLLFSGWMFASSPAVNSLEHPVYDIWLVSCQHEVETHNNESQ
ncbi:MAG: DUF2155 domain-containing protein [Alphaproteobacteria bacterium]